MTTRSDSSRRLTRLGPLTALCPLVAILAASAGAQDQRIPLSAPRILPQDHAAPAREVVAGGVVRRVPIRSFDDSIPLPIGATSAAGIAGDVETGPASGDPFFLGFAAGSYYPPADEVVDPLLRRQVELLPADRANGETCAFVMFSKRMTDERIAALEAQGARVLGRHPHYALKVALRASAIDAVGALDFVRWIGVPRDWQKVHPNLALRLQGAAPSEPIDVYVSLFESDLTDAATFEVVGSRVEIGPEGVQKPVASSPVQRRLTSGGWREARLRQAGLQVRSYHDSIASFRARVSPADVATIRDLDFVQFVELEITAELMNDESIPMIGADLTRITDTGGTYGNMTIGEVDSGIESSHVALDHVFGIGLDLATGNAPWDDVFTHGSHVAGTYFGLAPGANDEFTGVAHGSGQDFDHMIFNVKLFDDAGIWGAGATLDDVLDFMHTDYINTPYPRVVSNSWGSGPSSPPFVGSEYDCRLLDGEVYFNKQLYVFAAGNWGPGAGTTSMQATSKNVFSVGNVVPYAWSSERPGDANPGSSRGPCGDGRWKPNICAPGTRITSVDSSTPDGYKLLSGTSMAAPHLSGVAAQLGDKYSFLRDNPYALAAVLMATAMTRDNQVLSTSFEAHLDTYGAGRVESYKALNGDSQQALYFWAYRADSTSAIELDFDVFNGATRLACVMHYHELAASPGASKALRDDVDMRLDRAPFTGSSNTGDYTAQTSTINNTEIRILDNPGTGKWKIKLYPADVAPSMGLGPWVGISLVVSYGDTTPDGTFSLTADKAYALPGETVTFDASVYNPTYVASAVYLETTKTSPFDLTKAEVILADGAIADLTNNKNDGHEVLLGDIVHGQTRAARWQGSWPTEGGRFFTVDLDSENMDNETMSVQVIVDGTPPDAPTGLGTTTHEVNGHYCGTQNITVIWSLAWDALSGTDGYSVAWSHSAGGDPDTSIDTNGLIWTESIPAQDQPWYFHVRAIDNAGNAGPAAHLGPFFIGESQVTNYCNSNPNSTGAMAELGTLGMPCLATSSLTLRAQFLPTGVFGYYLFSEAKGNVPLFAGSQGVLCLGGQIIRFSNDVLQSDVDGVMQFSPDLSNLPQNEVFQPGSIWNFQLWYRDGQASNTSNGIEIVFD